MYVSLTENITITNVAKDKVKKYPARKLIGLLALSIRIKSNLFVGVP